MDTEDIKRIELKIDILLKGFFSFYGGDSTTYEWDHAFDEMKNEVENELLQLLDLPKDDAARKAFIESFGFIPFNGRSWWSSAMATMLERDDTRLQALVTLASVSGATLYGHALPSKLRPLIQSILKDGKSKEVEAITQIYSLGIDYADETPLIGKTEILALAKDKDATKRQAILKAIQKRLQYSEKLMMSADDFVKSLLPLSNDTSEKVIEALVSLLQALSDRNYEKIDLTPYRTSKNDRIRYIAVRQFLGHTDKGWRMSKRVDLKVVAKLVSDSYSPISKIATEYLDNVQSRKRF